MPKKHLIMLVGILLLVTGVIVAQENTTVLSIAVPNQMADALNNGILDQFEIANPGVQVHVIETGGGRFGGANNAQSDIEGFLDGVEESVTEADVLLVNSSDLTPETTRAGYYLDIAPLVGADAALAPGDFYPSVWESYQWDGAMWGLPVAADVVALLYDPLAFDTAGLAYPEAWWTFAELEQAIRGLAVYDDAGNLEAAPLVDLNDYLRIVLLNETQQFAVDDSVMPNAPALNNVAWASLMEKWASLQDEGLIAGLSGGINFDAPLMLAPSVLSSVRQIAGEKVLSFVPGGFTAVDVTAFVISNGTQSPELAYALASYLVTSPEVVNAAVGVIPAHNSLQGIAGDVRGGANGDVTTAPQETLDMLFSSYGVNDLRFSEGIGAAVDLMLTDDVDAQTALQTVELETLDRLVAADNRTSTVIQVAPPILGADLAPGEVSISFAINSAGRGGLPTQAEWDRMIETFVANDFEVGQVDFSVENERNVSVDTLSAEFDCFALPSNAVQGADLATLLSLDPLLSSDFSFDANDIVGDVLAQVQQNNQTWAMPLYLQPEVLLYNTQSFLNAGAFEPYAGWGVTDFEDSLRTVDFSLLPEEAPFVPGSANNTYLLTLMAAYGGVPIDFSTDPMTLNFTDSATVKAIRQVLDLAKEGLLDYEELSGVFNGGPGLAIGLGSDEDVAIYNQLLNSFLFDELQADANYDFVTYPLGTQYSGISYDIGTAYISATAEYPDACYRFISAIAQNPALFPSAMPVRRSILNSPAVTNVQGEEAVAFYNSVDQTLQAQNIIQIPTPFSGGIAAAGDFLTMEWLNQAFDAYVFDDADLEFALADAQQKATDFQACLATIPPFDPGQTNGREYRDMITGCAEQVDSEFSL